MNGLEKSRRAVFDTAGGLAAGKRPFLESIRKLAALRFDVSQDDHDPDFMLFVAIASESDHLPPHEIRSHCTSAWLEKCDRDAQELARIFHACSQRRAQRGIAARI